MSSCVLNGVCVSSMTELGELLHLLRSLATGVGRAVDLLETRFSGKENARPPVAVSPAANASLHDAVKTGDAELVARLLKDKKIDLSAGRRGSHANSVSPLHAAAAGKFADIVRLLLDAGASPMAVDAQGRTALHSAARAGDFRCCQILVRANSASLKCRDKDGNLPADFALMNRHFSLHKFLLNEKATTPASVRVFATPRESLTPRSVLASPRSLRSSLNSLPAKLAQSPYATFALAARSTRPSRSKSADRKASVF